MSGQQWVFPASLGQERTWLTEQQQGGTTVYTLPCHGIIETALEGADLVTGLRHVVQRHEALRTTLRMDGDTLHQVVHEEVPVEVPLLDRRDLGPAALDAALDLTTELAAQPIGTGEPPLWRAVLVRLTDTRWHLGFVVHHIVFDASSWVLLLAELRDWASATEAGREPDLPELPIQYADFAAWQRGLQDEGPAAAHLEFWRSTLRDAPTVHAVPTDAPRPAEVTFAGGDLRFELPDGLFDSVSDLAREHRATPFMVLLAAWAATVARLSGETDVVIGSTSAGRDAPQTAPLIGMFINQLVLRTDLSGNPTFGDLVERVRDVALTAMEHRETPFQRIVDVTAEGRTPGIQPVYQIGFNFIPETGLEHIRYTTTKDDLAFDITTRDGRLLYRTDLFSEQTAAGIVQRFLRLLQLAVERPDTALSGLPLVTSREEEDLLRRGTGPTPEPAAADAGLVPDLVGAQDPDRVALVDLSGAAGERLTYRELNAAANRLAHALRETGVGPDDRVAVALPSSAALVVALLGVLRSGAAYLPLDPEHPEDRLLRLQADAGVTVLVAGDAVRAADGVHRLDPASVGDLPDAAPETATGPDHLAYVLYTSGSTGTPKAVAVTHGNLAAYLAWARASYPGLTGTSLLHSPVSFDLTVTGLFGTLSAGGTVQLGELEAARAGDGTFCKVTPSHLQLLAGLPDILAPGADLVIGGESLTAAALAPWRDANPGVRVTNEYGPTEATVGCVAQVLPAGAVLATGDGPVPIGEPVWHTRVYVLDEHLALVSPGAAGELYVAGAQVTRGYLGRPGMTAERFLPCPYGPDGSRMYRTGDLVRWNPQGSLEYLGRADDQIKLHGYRIEPGEIESAMRGLPGVESAAVIALRDAPEGGRLVGYLTGPADPAEVRTALAGALPGHLVPDAVVRLEALPLTAHGKLDRQALPTPDPVGSEGGYVAPRTQAEELVAGVFAELLGIDRVGATDDFFALGGNSLLAIRAISRIRGRLDIQIPVRGLFSFGVVSELAGEVERRLDEELGRLSDEEIDQLLADEGSTR